MLIKIICVGKIKDRNISGKINEFIKWLGKFGKLEIMELKDSTQEKEGAALLKALEKERGEIFVLSEEGREFTSREFSKKIASADRKLVFVIGGPFGITREVKAKADCLMALSRMTMTHEMARMFLLEQLYRGLDIARGGKYHNP
ncbi:23S rRNA (pseudouridine(1915)-N(3))-methyltransferase RlmH [Lentisphaerota bacterium ZTH]|nr:23S rRNA (pseudouridine(1915)-N(3))-methyltransferase RlmH [Lentisphaerota bacterium]WET05651.1 23S rRNA (pseudouridine(1915)-N(3))-methyltransferase RlmH [Lentisphaerota bacterium ZTH]